MDISFAVIYCGGNKDRENYNSERKLCRRDAMPEIFKWNASVIYLREKVISDNTSDASQRRIINGACIT